MRGVVDAYSFVFGVADEQTMPGPFDGADRGNKRRDTVCISRKYLAVDRAIGSVPIKQPEDDSGTDGVQPFDFRG